MIIDHVYHALHPFFVYGIHQTLEIIQGAVFRIYGSVITDSIGGTQSSLPVLYSYRMNGQQIYNIHSHVTYPVQITLYSRKGPFFAVITNKDLVHQHISQLFVGILFHRTPHRQRKITFYQTMNQYKRSPPDQAYRRWI